MKIFLQINSKRCLLGFGPFEKMAQPPSGKTAFYLPDFFLEDPTPWWLPSRTEIISATALEIPTFVGIDWTPPSREKFNRDFADLQKKIAKEGFRKGVPVFFERGKMKEHCSASFTTKNDGDGYYYGFQDGTSGMVGCTPEILFAMNGCKIKTMALAGTLESGATEKKLQQEQEWVVEDIVTQLKNFGTPNVGKRISVKAGELTHLKTDITVTADQPIPFEDLIRTLHPTPALGTYPRDAQMKWLKHQAPDRGRFGAPFGVLFPDGEAICLVAIRNVIWNADSMEIGSGAGVIASSDLHEEWEELRLKRESVKKMTKLLK